MLSIHLKEKPTAEECAMGLKLMVLVAGADVMSAAVHSIGLSLSTSAAPAAITAAAPPPPPPGAGAGAPPPPPPGAAAVETDSSGLPWHADIHASTKSKNTDGTWKKKRGVQEAVVTRIEAELRALHPATPAAPPPPPPGAAALPPLNQAPPAPPATPAAPPPPPPPANNGALDFVGLMQKITDGLNSNPPRYTQQMVNDACARCGVPNAMAVSTRPDLAPTIGQWLDHYANGGQ